MINDLIHMTAFYAVACVAMVGLQLLAVFLLGRPPKK